MAFLVGGANSASSAYEIENSCRFNRGDSPALSYSFSSTDSSWTVSCWIKRAELSTNTMYPFGFGTAGTDATGVSFSSSDSMAYYDEDGSTLVRDTTILFRDPSAWYHLVCKNDGGTITTYMNGVQQATGSGGEALDGSTFYVGRFAGSTAYHWDGYISEFYFIDGTAYSPSTFGETDSNGVWVPIEASPTFGSDGFFCEFKETGTSANSSGIGADTSGNDNHLTVSNLAATDITTDTPTNNFATFNPLDNYYQQYTYAEGNLKVSTNADYYNWNTSTIGVNSGKWYVEGKMTQTGTGTDNWVFGVATYQVSNNNHGLGADNYGIAYRNNGNYKTGDANNTHGASFSANDIVMIALDLDNDKVYFGHGGQWADGSGNTDESDLSNSSSAVDTSGMRSNSQKGDTVFFAFGDWNSNAASTVSIGEFNFGNPIHSISSGNADANGYGNFEYAPPSGFYALCTKNLAKYG